MMQISVSRGALVVFLILAISLVTVQAQPSPNRRVQLQELFGRPMVGGGLQKRPFCNAFTGCAGKRTPFALPLGDKQRLRFFRKFNSIDAPTLNWALVRGDNSGTSQSRREKNTGQRPGALSFLRDAADENNYL